MTRIIGIMIIIIIISNVDSTTMSGDKKQQ